MSGQPDPACVSDVSLGLVRLGQTLPDVRGLTPAGDLQRVLEANAQNVVDAAGGVGAAVGGRIVQAHQEANRGFFQRTFGVSARRQAEEEQRVRAGAEVAGTVLSTLAGLAVTSVQRRLEHKDRIGSALKVRQVIGLAAQASGGGLTEASQIILHGAMDGLGLSIEDRAWIEAQPLPGDASQLQGCALSEPLLSAVVAIAFCAMAAATSTADAQSRLPRLLLHVGLPLPTAEAATERARVEYESARLVLTDHYQVLQWAVSGTALQLGLPVPQIMAVAERVVAFNPYEQARQQNRQLLAAFVGGGCRWVGLQTATPIGPGMSVAASLLGRLLGPGSGVSAPQITGAFQSFGTANGLAPDQLGTWAQGQLG